METSSPRFKSIAVSAGLTFWFIIITSSTGMFSIELSILFIGVIFSVTQIFANKISKGLDIERIKMESSCENIIDLREIFSEFDESKIFFDVGHMSDRGNEIISNKLFELSLPMVENTP